MKFPHSIPLWHTNGELFAGGTPSPVVLSSVGTKWNDIVLEQRHFPSSELAAVMFKPRVIVINITHSITGEHKNEGRLQPFVTETTALSLITSIPQSSPRLKPDNRASATS